MIQSVFETIEKHRADMVQTLSELIAIPSVANSSATDGFPYGAACAQALDYMLNALSDIGMTCRNHAYQMGTADWDTTRPPHLGILCHLDVVPAAAAEWQSPPFQADIREGRIYGRGAIDDKGPATAVFYALKALRETGVSLRHNVQFLLGCNEENGSTDLAYYCKQAVMPPYVFTPDGSYPLIHLEKGMLRLTFTKKVHDPLTAFEAGTAPNAVPALASCTVAQKANLPVPTETMTQAETSYTYQGTAAHASTPELGSNAITGLLAFWADPPGFGDCAALAQLFPHDCTDGSGLGIACADAESGALTCALTMLHIQQGIWHGCIDIRFPICTTAETLIQQIRARLAQAGFSMQVQIQSRPHHTPQDNPFVQTLLNVYTEQTGRPGSCIAIGGGTYVHDIPGGVAFGMEYPGWDYHMHGTDEFLPIDQLIENTKMMAAAILAVDRLPQASGTTA